MQRRVRFAVLLQLAEHGGADRATTAAMVPGTNAQDLITALENLIDEGSIEAETGRPGTLLDLAEAGRVKLTVLGRLRLDEDAV